jgi:O-antigen ligase
MQTFHAPHNTFIDVTVRLGIVGLALFLFIAFIFGRMGWQLIRYGRDDFIKTWALCLTATFVSFLIQGMFVDLLLDIQIIIFFILMAMLTVLWRFNEEQEDRIQLEE